MIVLPARVVTKLALADIDSSWRSSKFVRKGLLEHLVSVLDSYGQRHPDPAGEHRLPAAALPLGWQRVW